MKQRNRYLTARTLMGVMMLIGAAGAIAGDSISGVFEVNNTLPQDAELSVVVYAEGADEPMATQQVAASDGEVGYEFSGLAAGAHHVDLVASLGEIDLVLSRQEPGGVAEAIGIDGAVAGTVTLSGEPPAGRLLLMRADRTDIEVSGMPDQLNRMSYEVEKDEVADNRFEYEFEGMSYGVYRVELVGYDYQSHQVEVYGTLPDQVVIDAREVSATDQSFSVEFAAGGE